MVLKGEYAQRSVVVRDQVEVYERSAGQEANTLRDTGLPIIVVRDMLDAVACRKH